MADTLKRTRDLLGKLDEILVQLDTYVEWEDPRLLHRAPDISGWSVAQQVHHTGISTGLMLLGTERIRLREGPAEPEGSVNTAGKVILRLGRMPRGRARAPGKSLPADDATRDDVVAAIERARTGLQSAHAHVEALAEATWRVKHPYLGMLDARDWLRLADIHARHHFRIIDEIDRAR